MIEIPLSIISDRPEKRERVINSLGGYPYEILHYSNAVSFSWLVNQAILQSEHDIVIICSDKVLATEDLIEECIQKINEGYGFVAQYAFGFFALHKDVIRKIGWFDERFVGGGFEDGDFEVRLIEGQIPYILKCSAQYIREPSTWKYTKNDFCKEFFIKKWGSIHLNKAVRQLPEETNYEGALNSVEDKRYCKFSLSYKTY